MGVGFCISACHVVSMVTGGGANTQRGRRGQEDVPAGGHCSHHEGQESSQTQHVDTRSKAGSVTVFHLV